MVVHSYEMMTVQPIKQKGLKPERQRQKTRINIVAAYPGWEDLMTEKIQ